MVVLTLGVGDPLPSRREIEMSAVGSGQRFRMIARGDAGQLEAAVNRYIEEGWIHLGSPVAERSRGGLVWHMALWRPPAVDRAGKHNSPGPPRPVEPPESQP